MSFRICDDVYANESPIEDTSNEMIYNNSNNGGNPNLSGNKTMSAKEENNVLPSNDTIDDALLDSELYQVWADILL